MELEYRQAAPGDLELLIEIRLTVLRAANQLEENEDLSHLREPTRVYYEKALKSGDHVAYLAFDGGRFVGAGGISFYRVLPTCSNPSGQKGYIMNMYTAPSHRRRGIASHTLRLLTDAALRRGIAEISLEATPAGRPLYEKHGFISSANEMELPLHKL